MKKYLLILTLIYSLVIVSACPTAKANLETYQKRSQQFATATNEGVNLTRTLWQSGAINLDQKDKIADAFISLARSGEMVDLQIETIVKTYGENVPKDKLDAVIIFFRTNIIDGFLDAFEQLKGFNINSKYRLIISSIKTSVILLAQVFKIEKQTEAKLAEVN